MDVHYFSSPAAINLATVSHIHIKIFSNFEEEHTLAGGNARATRGRCRQGLLKEC
jgi:hypothetical protein